MQEKQEDMERERARLVALSYLEGLGKKKANIYARLLTEVNLAQSMEELAKRHSDRENALKTALGEKPKKGKEG